MSYSVKEIYYTLQGEGARTGRAAVFLRFAGCNLWTGQEKDRSKAVCQFCDTDFVGTDGLGGGVFKDAQSLAASVLQCWNTSEVLKADSLSLSPSGREGQDEGALTQRSVFTPPHPSPLPQGGRGSGAKPYVVCTGGEPLLQLDDELITALHALGFEIGIETNGTLEPPSGIDWICVSPKANAALVLTRGNELKLIYPQAGAAPERYAGLQFENFFLQPMDSPARAANTDAAMQYCLKHPQWRLSLQTHKLIGIR